MTFLRSIETSLIDFCSGASSPKNRVNIVYDIIISHSSIEAYSSCRRAQLHLRSPFSTKFPADRGSSISFWQLTSALDLKTWTVRWKLWCTRYFEFYYRFITLSTRALIIFSARLLIVLLTWRVSKMYTDAVSRLTHWGTPLGSMCRIRLKFTVPGTSPCVTWAPPTTTRQYLGLEYQK